MTTDAAEDPGDIALVEPARQQVIALAADLLGRLPAEEVPTSLRPFARFAPSKRRRLGAAVLAAVLDSDDEFRAKVAEAVEQTSQELVEAVRERRVTPAADPIDIGVVAYLTRPDGWQDAVAQANARWTADRGATAAASDETARLRAELTELRAQVRGEKARLRDALARAGEETRAELATLRQSLRDRTRELRATERQRDAARADGAELEARVEKERAAHDAELRRLRGRISEAERGAEAARRAARAERDVDDSRLWLLVDTLVQAATGVRRELSLSAPTARPTDAIGSAGIDGGGRRAVDPAAFDRLLGMPNVHLVIDGYNVTKTGYGELSLADQRARLVGGVAALHAQSGAEITVVFDGGSKPPVQPPTPRGIRVLFSAADEIADDLIRRIVAGEPAGRPVVVVTSDQQVVRDTARDGAWSVPSAVFVTRLT